MLLTTLLTTLLVPIVRATTIVATGKRVLLLLKAVSTVRGFGTRFPKSAIVVSVVHKAGLHSSELCGKEVQRAINVVGKRKLRGRVVRATSLAYSSSLAVDIASQKADIVYVCDGLRADIPNIAAIAKKRSLLTLATRPDDVRAGLALGVERQSSGTAKFIVHLAAIKDQGAKFPIELLQLAYVVR
ncbi:MAG: YfiR family protein [Deltaproteobacteria bacterium]|nr:YfiR family protein [Deltaproteobacteria bacterium]